MAKHCIRSCVVHKCMLEKVPLLKNVPLNEKDTQLVSSKKKRQTMINGTKDKVLKSKV